MIIVNTNTLFNQLKQQIQSKPFVLLQMYSDVKAHPQENRVSCYYVDFQDEQYIVPIHHTEKYQDNIELIETEQTIFVQEYTLKINPNEFNSTNNPTAAKFVSGSKLLRANLTGSSWSPYMTTIKFYSDDDFYPVMIARYPQPIKMRDDMTLIFKIRQDF